MLCQKNDELLFFWQILPVKRYRDHACYHAISFTLPMYPLPPPCTYTFVFWIEVMILVCSPRWPLARIPGFKIMEVYHHASSFSLAFLHKTSMWIIHTVFWVFDFVKNLSHIYKIYRDLNSTRRVYLVIKAAVFSICHILFCLFLLLPCRLFKFF